MQTLLPLIRQILDNIERIGPRAAWTGPLSRGDYAIVARHVRALQKYPREIQQAYAASSLLAGRLLAKNPDAALKKIGARWRRLSSNVEPQSCTLNESNGSPA